LGSVDKAAARFGMHGSSVHERLKRLGLTRPVNLFTEADKAVLFAEYEEHASSGHLADLASKLGRTRQFICRQAKKLGLTDRARSKSYLAPNISANMRAWHKANPHPRGMLGKKHSPAVRAIMCLRAGEYWSSLSLDERAAMTLRGMKTRVAPGDRNSLGTKTSWKAGWREVGGRKVFFRSRWEANYARYLEWLKQHGQIREWEHEPEVFWFEKIKRGVRSYLPDFRVTENNGAIVYHEVKGWMDDRSRTCLNRMRIYYPATKIILVDSKSYRAIRRDAAALVPEWENDKSKIQVGVAA